MKKNLLALGIIMLCFVLESHACATSVPTISGPAIIELNTSGNQFTLVMDAAYKSSSGGYTNTEWSFQGIGIVGYGETFTLNTTSASWSNLAEGIYMLTAKNQFGGSSSCFGCISNTTFTKPVEFRRPRPDLIITAKYFDENSNNLAQNTSVTTDLIVSNIGNAASPPVSVTISLNWKNSSGSENNNSITFSGQTIQPGGNLTIPFVSIQTPSVLGTGTSETWTLTCTVDSNNDVAERFDNNNSKSYSRTITRPSSRIATSEESYSNVLLVTNMDGELIWKKGQEPVDFSKLRGAYIFKFEENGFIRTQKIVKQ